MKTELLFYQDVRRTEFQARVIGRREDKNAVILDATCFYPESGGQLPDTGTLNGIPVTDVQEEGEVILQVLDGALPEGVVNGKVDWGVRFDHMQQHTGQHILSGAFDQTAKAMTVGFHMGIAECTIDLRVPRLTEKVADEAEDLANRIVFENRPVQVHLLDRDEAARLPLRKKPPDLDRLRVLEIKDFDYSACGGTHCERAGEVGLIKITRWERIRNDIRVEFLCGWRALKDYRWRNRVVNHMAGELSVAGRDLEQAIERLHDENQGKAKRIRKLMEGALIQEAKSLVDGSPSKGSFRLIVQAFPDRDPEEVRVLAGRIAEHKGTVALLASTRDKTYLVFARSTDVDWDMDSLMKEAVSQIQGKCGGRSNFAQGGGPLVPDILSLLQFLSDKITANR